MVESTGLVLKAAAIRSAAPKTFSLPVPHLRFGVVPVSRVRDCALMNVLTDQGGGKVPVHLQQKRYGAGGNRSGGAGGAVPSVKALATRWIRLKGKSVMSPQ